MVTNNLKSAKITNAVGIWFYSQSTNRYLYLIRNDPKHPDSWGLPGGKMEAGESIMAAMVRECEEEIGSMPDYIKLMPLEKFTSADNGFVYNTFFCVVDGEFSPKLNDEHSGYAWIDSGTWPKPLHPGLWSTINFEAVQSKISIIQQQLQTSQ
jgi:8-oxo-dGTP pyrophosphatase MutT (NUDIX family)